MRIIFTGGGTGGHFYPLMAIAESLRAGAAAGMLAPPELYYMGPGAYDANELARLSITYVHCPAGKARRYRSILNIFDPFVTGFGFLVALWKLFILYPDVVMSKGGYASVPIVTAAWLLRIPIVIHESDSVPGRANRLGRRFATYIAISYPEAAEHFPAERTALTGIPMRAMLKGTGAESSPSALGIDPNLPLILVLGGSQGADRVNALILDTLDELLPSYSIIHQTGPSLYEGVVAAARSLITDNVLLSHYHPTPFMQAETLERALSTAAVVISRAGSTTIHEIAAHGKPSILIPIPEDISHDQRSNAYAYARRGAAEVIEEHNMTDGLLTAEINRIMGDQTLYGRMAGAARAFAPTDAAEKIAGTLTSIGKSHE